jgi:putative aldouronate transport system permease protein
MMKKTNKPYRVFQFFNGIIMLCVIVITLLPVLNVVAKSFSDLKYITANAVLFWPKGFTIKTYQVVTSDPIFWVNYKNTVIYTIIGTLVSLFMTTIFAYALSVPRLKGKKFFSTFAVFTMFFNGGMIPNYLLVRNLGMRNTIWAVVIPGAISTFNLIVMRTFFEGLPHELEEAASIDGMDTYGILTHIILPLSKPILATMTLFYAVGAWNAWFGPFLYLDNSRDLPVSVYLRNIIAGAMASGGTDADSFAEVSANIRAVTIVLTALPIMCVYPFIQKYFVQGITIGSVKG